MLNLETVKADIERWIIDFVEVPHPALGGWAPCPYARKARLDRDFTVRIGVNPYFDLLNIAKDGLGGKSVLIIAYDPDEFFYSQFTSDIKAANEEALLRNNILALEDHPGDPEIVNGVCMNQGIYALALVQSLSDLNEKAQLVAKKGFYDTWPEDYLQALFKHRIDPRAT
jgi:hypothetical protein